MPAFAYGQEEGPGDKGQHGQRAADIPPRHGEVGRCRADVEAQQGEGKDLQLSQVGAVMVTQVVGQGQRSLLGVVGGEDGGAVKAAGAAEAAPLDAHGKEDGIQSHHNVQRFRQEGYGHGGCGGDNRRYIVHIPAPPVGQQHRQHSAQHVQHQRAQVQEHGVQIAAQGVQQQLDQVHRLGVAHDAAVDKNSVAAEEAAHGTEGQVAV